MNKKSWIWIENLFKKIPLPYPLVSALIGIILFFVFVFFSFKVSILNLNINNIIVITSMCLLISYQLFGIQYLTNLIRISFKEMKKDNTNDEVFNDLYSQMEERFTKSKLFYIIVAFVVLTFLAVDATYLFRGEKVFYYDWEKTNWSLMLDIYNTLLAYLINFLLAIVIWIIVNIIWFFNQIGNEKYKTLIDVDVFCLDETCGLGYIKNLALKSAIYYVTCISLAILSYYNTFRFFSIPTTIYLILLALGLILIITGFGSVQKVFRRRKNEKISNINNIYTIYRHKFLDIILKNDKKIEDEELKLVCNILEYLNTELEKLKNSNMRIYNLQTLIKLILTFTAYIFAYLLKIELASGIMRLILGKAI